MTQRDIPAATPAGALCASPETTRVPESQAGARARSVFDSALLDGLVFATGVVALGAAVLGLGF